MLVDTPDRVLVQSTANEITIGADGRFFSLANMPARVTLVFSFIGYVSVERRASNEPLDVNLNADTYDFNKVIVLIYRII